MVEIVDDAAATIRVFEEIIAQKNAVIALKNTTIERLQIEGERTVGQNTFINSEVITSKRLIKLPDPLIFESREQNIEF
jgi:hypothetical protein